MVPLLIFMSVTVPILCTFFFFLFANGTVHSPCTFFFCQPIVLWFGQNHSMGDCSYPEWIFCFLYLNCRCLCKGNGQSALASNRYVEAGTVLGHGVSSLTLKIGALGIASGCCLCWGNCNWGWKNFLQHGTYL